MMVDIHKLAVNTGGEALTLSAPDETFVSFKNKSTSTAI